MDKNSSKQGGQPRDDQPKMTEEEKGSILYKYLLPDSELRTDPQLVNNESELKTLIKYARDNEEILRVEGSAHSVGDTIVDSHTQKVRLIRLADKFRSFNVLSSDGDTKIIEVGGGCYLGKNPLDIDSTLENSIIVQLAKINCAIPILGGITHQSIAGFMLTGSAGGSVDHGFEDVIKEIRFVDGQGESRVAKKGTDLFNAVGVSMGLFGIITYVVLEVKTPSFKVAGVSKTVGADESDLAVNPKTWKTGLQETLQNTEYYRAMWFPQKYAQKVMEWSGHRSEPSTETIPYKDILANPILSRIAATLVRFMHWYITYHPCEETYKIIGIILSLFTSGDAQKFIDVWYKTIPMDDQVPSDTTFKTDFTELWFPIEQTDNVLKILETLFEDQQVAGNYACEIYAAKRSPFWLSPSYNRDVVRVDIFWFHNQGGNAREYFAHYWNALLEVKGVRLHWGKYLPYIGETCGSTTYDLAFLKQSYTKLDDWLDKRKVYDPDQVFVTEYWRKIFGIEASSALE